VEGPARIVPNTGTLADVPPTVRRSLVSDQVFRILCEQILSGEYEPGEKLPTQRGLAADLGVNMASVREAVKRLEQLRLVEVRHGDAMRVRDWRAHGGLDVIAHVLFRAGGLDRATLSGLLEARGIMLTESARLAAERRTDAQARTLAELAERISGASDDESAQLADFAFFAELVAAAGNVVFVLVMNSIRELYLERAELFRSIVAPRGELVPLYRRAARAVAARSPARAAAVVRELADEQERRLREALA
jgi:DNA-binding FadR family transcriptional regulator